MKRLLAASIVLGLAACDQGAARQPAKPATSPEGRLEQLVASNATVVGYLYSVDKPYVIASFQNGALQWRHDPESKSIIQGPAEPYSEPDKSCVGFAAKNPSMPAQGPERFLVCEALRPIEHHNSLPRSQDFRLQAGSMFIEYQPPAGTGYAQLFYASRTK
ncbi:MAG TPA: hypothetical protein VE756_09460 [Burkholderiales bacterium]|nr:hypothetical protein [Burkholderiales bacterium]